MDKTNMLISENVFSKKNTCAETDTLVKPLFS